MSLMQEAEAPVFDMQTQLPVVKFDYESLVAQANAMVAKYEGLIVTEDQVKEIKKDMAELNATKARIDNARKEVVKKINEPVKAFEAQIKDVCAIFDRAWQHLNEQVQAFVQKEKEEKREIVKAAIQEELELQKDAIEPFPIPVQDNWLNKTTSMKAVREAIKNIIAQRIEMEAMRCRVEQARNERAAAIEQAVKAANESGASLSVSQFMTSANLDLDTPLAEVVNRVSKAAEQQTAKPEPDTASNKGEPHPDITMSILITFSPKNEAAVRFAITKLKSLCTSLAARRR